MKKLLIIFLLFSVKCFSQFIDTVIHAPNYTSYFNYSLHEPLYVVYKLYKAGGSCSRAGDYFKTGGLPNSATGKDYAHNGFDEGHLADSKDFAYDCSLQEATCWYQRTSIERLKANHNAQQNVQ